MRRLGRALVALLLVVCSRPARAEPNRPPVWAPPAEFEQRARERERFVTVRVGRPLALELRAEDPEEDPLTYAAEGLPRGASFDAAHASVRWTPGPGDVGTHRILFTASDAEGTATVAVSVRVVEDRAPLRSQDLSAPFELVAGSRYWQRLASDPDPEDVLSYRVVTAPRGAEFDVRDNELFVRLRAEAAAAEPQPLVVVVSDGERSTELRESVYAYDPADDRAWHFYLAPGLGYVAYVPLAGAAYQGLRSELTLAGARTSLVERRRCERAPETSRCDVSHLRVFAAFEAAFSMSDRDGTLFAYSAGFSRSLERNPARDVLVPHFFIEAGGMTSRSVPHSFQVTPGLGLHLVARRPWWLDVALGARVVPQRIDSLTGLSATFSATFDPY